MIRIRRVKTPDEISSLGEHTVTTEIATEAMTTVIATTPVNLIESDMRLRIVTAERMRRHGLRALPKIGVSEKRWMKPIFGNRRKNLNRNWNPGNPNQKLSSMALDA